MRRRIALSLLFAAAAAWACAAPPASEAPDGGAPKLWDRLGGQTHPITTNSPLAQKYFDQGMSFVYGFNHEAAIGSFREAQRLDPSCAMCVWGEALALGPNINAPIGPEASKAAYAAIQRALKLGGGASEIEKAYLSALALRYAEEPPEDRASLDRAYADAMRGVYQMAPLDNDAATLLAEALMDLYPWNYWEGADQPRPETEEALILLETVLAREPEHLGANHYLIHAVEEYHPTRAEPAADRLANLAPDAGHLVHMPSHIYWRVGRYEDAKEINQRATLADEQFFSTCSPGAFYRAAYYPHNIHFLWAAASAEGQGDLAMMTARKLAAKTAPALEDFPFMSEFMTTPWFTQARFGQWDAILGNPRPDPARPYLTGIWHYARGLAFLRTEKVAEAKTELAAVDAQAAREESAALILAGGTASAQTLLAIASDHLRGELAHAEGRKAEAVDALESAVSRQDSLIYMEPPPWYFPTRQALGAILLEQERAADAEGVYRKDLEQHPKNGWATFGLAASLRAQGKDDSAAAAEFAKAWKNADVELKTSRF